ncbi:MAG: hypothetical protein HQ518_20270 [Rhodopirellula sp.]|nr:hypothetical protein [Rhodopirellula sp.]
MSVRANEKPASSVAAPAVSSPGKLVNNYPLSSVLVVFGVGLGLGVVLGSFLDKPKLSRLSFAGRTEHAAEKLGRQILDAIAGTLPESFTKRS